MRETLLFHFLHQLFREKFDWLENDGKCVLLKYITKTEETNRNMDLKYNAIS